MSILLGMVRLDPAPTKVGNPYRAYVYRDTNKYPMTAEGTKTLEYDAAHGLVELITEVGGFVIPIGTAALNSKTVTIGTDPGTGGSGNDGNLSGTDPIANTPFLDFADQGWPEHEKWLENSKIKIGFSDHVSGTAKFIFDKIANAGENLLNTPKMGDAPGDGDDLGRGLQFRSDYWQPAKLYNSGGQVTNQFGNLDTGGNTVEAGTQGPHYAKNEVQKAAIVPTQDRGNVYAMASRGKFWSLPDRLSHFSGQDEVWLVPGCERTFGFKIKHVVGERPSDDSPPLFTSRGQENPCLFGLANMTYNPLVAGGVTNDLFPGIIGPVTFSDDWFADDNAIGMYRPNGGVGYRLYMPGNSCYRAGSNGGTDGDWRSTHAAYIAASHQFNYDNPGVYWETGYIAIGTKAQCEADMASLPGIDQSVNFNFVNNDNHRWFNGDARLKKEVINSQNRWVLYIGDSKVDGGRRSASGSISSPARSWVPEAITKINFKMSVFGVNELWFKFHKTGKSGSKEYRYKIQVIGDGVERTYTVNTADVVAEYYNVPWNGGRIAWFGLQGVTPEGSNPGFAPENPNGPAAPDGAKIILTSVTKN